jgi:metal-responsive CopG/Arc/MetJ family transcriptional regulator
MKTAISVPDQVFSRAKQFARRRKMSRSTLFTAAVAEYIQRRRTGDVTRKLNEIYLHENSSLDPALANMQSFSLPKEEW